MMWITKYSPSLPKIQGQDKKKKQLNRQLQLNACRVELACHCFTPPQAIIHTGVWINWEQAGRVHMARVSQAICGEEPVGVKGVLILMTPLSTTPEFMSMR